MEFFFPVNGPRETYFVNEPRISWGERGEEGTFPGQLSDCQFPVRTVLQTVLSPRAG
jgi:hypothetical protein